MKRSLKIEETGDFWAKRIKPLIRLRGKWLRDAGFAPGGRVEVILQNPGCILLQAHTDSASLPSTGALSKRKTSS